MIEKMEGITLRTIDYKDSSKIIYLITPYGKKNLILKGCKNYKNKNNKFKDIYQELSFYNTNKELGTFIDGDIINDFKNIKNDLDKYETMSNISNLVYKYLDDNLNYLKLYKLIKTSFYFIDNLKIDTNLKRNLNFTYLLFLLKFLYFIGYQPNFESCNICKSKEIKGFSIKNASVACLNHLDETSLDKNQTTKLIDFILLKFDDILNYKIKEEEINFYLDKIQIYYNYHVFNI